MNANKLKKALKEYEGFVDLQANELTTMLLNDGYNEAEAAEIIEKLQSMERVEKFNISDLTPKVTHDEDGDEILTASDAWKKYKEIEAALPGNKMIEFIQVNATPVTKLKKGNTLLIGLKLEKEKPLKSTFITVRNARLMNEQIYNLNTLPQGRFYYLIAEQFKF